MNSYLIISLILFSVYLIPFVLCLADRIFGTALSCRYFGWHNGAKYDGNARTFDGCSYHGVCSKCDKKVMQDSQGNWF